MDTCAKFLRESLISMLLDDVIHTLDIKKFTNVWFLMRGDLVNKDLQAKFLRVTKKMSRHGNFKNIHFHEFSCVLNKEAIDRFVQRECLPSDREFFDVSGYSISSNVQLRVA